MVHDPARVVLQAARRAAHASDVPLLLAVSGGLDSMALLVAMAETAPESVAIVATFDHGTGRAATEAASSVRTVARELGLSGIRGTMPSGVRPTDGWESVWRRERYRFLFQIAASWQARVATAHTEDDQVETVLMRELRGAGARGLAGLAAPSPIVRPFLNIRRDDLRSYLVSRGRRWHEDPSNCSPRFLRNRVRRELLPALRAVDPSIDAALLATGRAAARWRRELDAWTMEVLRPTVDGGGLSVASVELEGYDRDSLSIIWSALAGRAGLALDRRGTHRLAAFTVKGRPGSWIPLSGGWRVEARPGAYILRQTGPDSGVPVALPAKGGMEWGRFRFQAERWEPVRRQASWWAAALPADGIVRVRAWSAGDRLAPSLGQGRRRVARYLTESGVHGTDRVGWPVVEMAVEGRTEGDVLWIPGIRRSDAATERSGGPVRHYVCERIAP